MEEDDGVRWSELPEEFWYEVGKCFHSHIDVVRYRSVCRLWRSSVPPFPQTSPLRLRFPSTSARNNRSSRLFLSTSTVYRLAPADHEPSVSASSPLRRNGRLVRLEKSKFGKMRYLHPLTKRTIRFNFETLPKRYEDLNLLDLRINEVARSYSLKLNYVFSTPGIAKVVVLPDLTDADDDLDRIAIALWEKGKLGFARSGDKNWTLIDKQNFHYDDVIVYNKQVYTVDKHGRVFWIDSSMRLVQFYPPLIGFGQRKHLVECGGEILVIDRYLEEEERPIRNEMNAAMAIPVRRGHRWAAKAVDFKVYKLDQEWGRWVELKNLENRSIILGNDCCFSIDSCEFEGCLGNCIYYSDWINDNVGSNKRCSSRVFDLEGTRIGRILGSPRLFEIFSPPPIWLTNSPLPR